MKLEERHRSFKRDNCFLTMTFVSRFYNSRAQGVSGKNEQSVPNNMARGLQRCEPKMCSCKHCA